MTFTWIDRILISKAAKAEVTKGATQQGTTANVVLITKKKIYCANAGDSRAVVSQNGTAVELSYDHKPSIPAE